MGKHGGPDGYVPPVIDADSFDATMSNVQKELGVMRLEDALGALTPEAKKRRIRVVIAHLAKAGALGLLAVGVMVGGGVATAHSASAATVETRTVSAVSPTAPWSRHVTRFNRGTWTDLGSGYVGVSAPLTEYDPRFGWVPSPHEPVQVQEFTCGRWILRATLTTNGYGIADGMVPLGGESGVRVLRVVHRADAWTLGTRGSVRYVYVTGDPMTD